MTAKQKRMGLFIEAIREINLKKYQNINVKSSFTSDECDFNFVVFDRNSNNTSFYIYNHYTYSEAQNKVLAMLVLLELDDFKEIERINEG